MGSAPPHLVIFPFLAQGHIIPSLYLARLLRRRSAVITVVTSPGNAAAIRDALSDTDIRVVELPFPQNIDGVPAGVENAHKVPEAAFIPFARATKLMQKSFEEALETLSPPVSAVISDMFLGWTVDSAQKFGVPRYVFSGTGIFADTMLEIVHRKKPHAAARSKDEPFAMPDFPAVILTRDDFHAPFNEVEPSGPYKEFIVEQLIATGKSKGIIMNTFYWLEQQFCDYWNEKFRPKFLCVGPVCLAAPTPPEPPEKPSYVEFLDGKLESGEPVLYASFGTMAEVSEEQMKEIAEGLEKSGVNFLWVAKIKDEKFLSEFQGRVQGRGMLASKWVDQWKVLRHGAVKGFLSHCGWNSVTESISAGVSILALPFIVEQHLNARFVADVAGFGLRILAVGGSVRGFVTAEEIERKVRQLMHGEEGAKAIQKAAELSAAARDAVADGGSSYVTLDSIIAECMR